MVRTVASEHHWPLKEIGRLYLDNYDIEGLTFWYEAIAEEVKRMKEAAKNK